VRSTCISRERYDGRQAGFSLIELLVGLVLAVILALAVSPLWLSLQSGGAQQADETAWLLQGRVAVARFERDLRLAGAAGCPFVLTAPVLEASASQVVFLQRQEDGSAPIIVEWEIAGGCLMRRWGRCPSLRPSVCRHTLYRDHKTMVEGVGGDSKFAYVVYGVVAASVPLRADLAAIDGVVLELEPSSAVGHGSVDIATKASVGR
jgi:prepilin-type N-terminal cleavage/methylation domain-containing protein